MTTLFDLPNFGVPIDKQEEEVREVQSVKECKRRGRQVYLYDKGAYKPEEMKELGYYRGSHYTKAFNRSQKATFYPVIREARKLLIETTMIYEHKSIPAFKGRISTNAVEGILSRIQAGEFDPPTKHSDESALSDTQKGKNLPANAYDLFQTEIADTLTQLTTIDT